MSPWGVLVSMIEPGKFKTGIAIIPLGPSLNAVSRVKKSAGVRQADGPTNFNPI